VIPERFACPVGRRKAEPVRTGETQEKNGLQLTYLAFLGLLDHRFEALFAGGFGPGWPEFPRPCCLGVLTGL